MDIENKLMGTKRIKGGGTAYEFLVNIYPLLYKKQITNKYKLYRMWKYTQYFIITNRENSEYMYTI